jgi:glycosyltransferase involved in cell wall biosynthesis
VSYPHAVNVLLIAPTCDGTDVGEAWVAFQWVRRIAERHDATLLTYHKRDRQPAAEQLSGVRVVEWTEPPMPAKAERLNSMLKPGYVPFYLRARRWIRDAERRGERFDLAHQVAPVAMRYPSPAVGFDVPLVMGPVGGSLDNPPGFADDGDTAPWYVELRSLDQARLRFDPLLRRTYQSAACVIGIAPYVRELLAPCKIQRFELMSETGIESVPPPVDRSTHRGPVKLLYVGRVVRTKGLRDAIRALALLEAGTPVVLDVVGDGFDRETCEHLAAEIGVDEHVRFHGRLPRAEIDDFYRAADIFVFPSYREAGGNVAFEAMMFGLPLIVSDRGGPGNVVDESCGLRVHPTDPNSYARELAAAIRKLADDRDEREMLGAGARARVAEIALWDNKIDAIDRLYAEISEG